MAVDRQTPTKSGGAAAPAEPPSLQRTNTYLQETIVELKKTTWPSKQEASRLTMVVIGVIVVCGIYMGILDATFSYLVSKFQIIK